MFSVLILTLNEERNLPACLASAAGCDDLVVLDSGSTDRTAELARAAGARVFVRPFDNFAGQRNHAHRHIPFRHPWVFHLDADERLTPELLAECRHVASTNPSDVDGYYAAPRMLFFGRWVPHCTDFPAWQARFAHVQRFTFIEVGHGQRESTAMRMGKLAANYEHEMMASGETAWLEKHRRYARAEARTAAGPPARALCSGDALQRRRALKAISRRLPFRPALRFVYQYFLRRGFLDGAAGWRYCRLIARYEGFIAEEARRLRATAA